MSSDGPRQDELFDEDLRGLPEDRGYRVTQVTALAGISYRQLDHWTRTGLITPSVRAASGSGSQRLYSFRDVVALRVVKGLLDAGVSLPNVRTAVDYLRAQGVDDFAQLTLMSDGASIYQCTTDQEIIDLLRSGQGVFAIAVAQVWKELAGKVLHIPAESADADAASVMEVAGDELAARRRRRNAG